MPEKNNLDTEHGFHSKIIVVGFDGTCVMDKFPRMGYDNPGASAILRSLACEGHRIILYTCRRDLEPLGIKPRNYLTQAINWFKNKEIPLWGVNTNPLQVSRGDSARIEADLFIDVCSLGVPLISFAEGAKPKVDWIAVEDLLKARGYFCIGVR